MPRLSICVPSHKADFLPDLAKSIASQTFKDWEWVLLTNGDLYYEKAAKAIRPHLSEGDWKKVRIIQARDDTPRTVGALKREAFLHAAAPLIVESDHDDILTPDCLAEVHDAFEDGADFVYSNLAPFRSGTWESDGILLASMPTRSVTLFGHRLVEAMACPPSLHTLFFGGSSSPFHVRAWRKSVYEKIGGHNQALTLADDVELVIRTYLAGAKFVHIDKCLYLYRIADNQTSQTLGIDAAIAELMTYFHKLARPVLLKWCAESHLDVIDDPKHLVSTDTAGAVLADHRFGPVVDVLPAAHRALVHGGWLVATDMLWARAEVSRYTRPKYVPAFRFQGHYWKGGLGAGAGMGGEPLTVYLSAKKTEEPLPGVDLWSPKVNRTDVKILTPLFDGLDCTVRLGDNRLYVSGPADKLALALHGARQLSPVYEMLVVEEPVLIGE